MSGLYLGILEKKKIAWRHKISNKYYCDNCGKESKYIAETGLIIKRRWGSEGSIALFKGGICDICRKKLIAEVTKTVKEFNLKPIVEEKTVKKVPWYKRFRIV